ncbi:MAG: peptidylprolyl isomerase [Lentimicrobiaceae bacterium]|nr:peptidylprolyl isomerase [Lentimicrobiaceae bacterium]
MKKSLFVICIILSAFLYCTPVFSQVIDEVVATVGSKIVLKSDIETQYVQYRMQGSIGNASSMRCQFLENLLFDKLMLTQAELDSIQVTESQIEGTMNQRMRYYIQQFGSQEKLEEFYQKSLIEIKDELHDLIRDQLMIDQVHSKITADAKVTPTEVKTFFNRLPQDSIPFVETEYEIGQIVKQPPISDEALNEAKDKINTLRKRILNGEKFSTLAILYSEDPGSAKQGGELGSFGRGEMYPEFEAAAFSLKPNEVSNVIKTPAGFHIIQLIDRKGDYINARHILIQPKVSPYDLASANTYLDSIAKLIRANTITFEKAAQKYSDDPSKMNGGMMVNNATGNTRFEASQLDAKMFFVIDKLKIGEISNPVAMVSDDGKQAYRILYLKIRTTPHKANLKDDYTRFQQWALDGKKQEMISGWIKDKTQKTYISINEDYRDCNFTYRWTN